MAKIEIEIERGEATKTLPAKAKITLAKLRELAKAPDEAVATFVTANGSVVLDSESRILIEWTETKAVRSRKKEA